MRSRNKWIGTAAGGGIVDESYCSYDQDPMQMSFRRTDPFQQQTSGYDYHDASIVTPQDGTYGATISRGQEQVQQHGRNRQHSMAGNYGESSFSNMSSQSKPTMIRNGAVYLNQSAHCLPTHTLLLSTDGRTTLSQPNGGGAFSVNHHHSLPEQSRISIVAHSANAPPPVSHNGQYYLIPAAAPTSARNDFLYHPSVGINSFVTSSHSTGNSNIATVVVDPSSHQLVYHVQSPSSSLITHPSPVPTTLPHQQITSYPYSNRSIERRNESDSIMRNNQYHDADSQRFFQQGPRRHYPPPS